MLIFKRVLPIFLGFLLCSCGSDNPNTSTSSSGGSSSSSNSSGGDSSSSSSSSSSSGTSSSSSSSNSSGGSSEPWTAGLSNPAIIENGVTLYDTNGKELHAHGAGIIKVGDYFYWYGENRYSDQSFKSVTMYRSKDLKNWTFQNDILVDTSDSDLSFAKIERPKIIYNESTGQYVMWMHKEGGDNYGQARAAVASSSTIDGNYTYHGSFRPLNHMSRDATAFVDTDGSAYFISAANENADLHIYRLTADYKSIDYLVQKIWVAKHREAPALMIRNGYYIIISSGTSGWDPNQARYGYATSIDGNWSDTIALGDSITFDSQPTFILPLEGASGTSYMYMGDRWLDPTYQDSKYVWLPIDFSGDTSLALNWSTRIAVDTKAGLIAGSGAEEFSLQTRTNYKCLDVADESKEDRANIVAWSCTHKSNQKWVLVDVDDQFFQIKSLHSKKCLDIASASMDDGANVLQWTCNQSDNQLWEKVSVDDSFFMLRSKSSGKCLDADQGDSGDSDNIQQWQCNQTENQQWREIGR